MKVILQASIVLLCAWSTVSAQTTPEIEMWQDTLARSSLTGIADRLRDSKGPKWPRIQSAFAYSQLPQNQRDVGNDALALADSLRQRLEGSFRANVQMDEEALRKEFDVLVPIKQALSNSGGYGNMVLGDSIAKLLIFRLSGWLIQNPAKVAEAEALFGRIDASQVDLQTLFSQLANQDRELAARQQAIGGIKRDESIYHALEPIGLNMNAVLGLNDPEQLKTSALLNQPSVPALAYRMVTTEALKWVHLRGLIQFFKAGGTLVELDPADVRKFEARIGAEARRYKYPLLNIRSLSEAHLLTLADLHRETEQRRAFLQVALE